MINNTEEVFPNYLISPISLLPFKDPVILPSCNHVFDSNDIFKINNSSCPLCRKEIIFSSTITGTVKHIETIEPEIKLSIETICSDKHIKVVLAKNITLLIRMYRNIMLMLSGSVIKNKQGIYVSDLKHMSIIFHLLKDLLEDDFDNNKVKLYEIDAVKNINLCLRIMHSIQDKITLNNQITNKSLATENIFVLDDILNLSKEDLNKEQFIQLTNYEYETKVKKPPMSDDNYPFDMGHVPIYTAIFFSESTRRLGYISLLVAFILNGRESGNESEFKTFFIIVSCVLWIIAGFENIYYVFQKHNKKMKIEKKINEAISEYMRNIKSGNMDDYIVSIDNENNEVIDINDNENDIESSYNQDDINYENYSLRII